MSQSSGSSPESSVSVSQDRIIAALSARLGQLEADLIVSQVAFETVLAERDAATAELAELLSPKSGGSDG